jgi:hypothetical protein
MSSMVQSTLSASNTGSQRMYLTHALGVILLGIVLLSMINGLMPQAEMAIFAGHVPIPSVVLKFTMILIAGMGILISRKVNAPPKVIYAWMILVEYVLFEFLFFTISKGFSLEYIAYSIEATLYFLLLLPFFYTLKRTVDEGKIIKIILLLFFPLAAVGLWQSLSNHPLLPTLSADKYFQVYSWDFYGRVRAFSFFGSASNFGHFLALVAAMSVVGLRQWRGRRRVLAALVLTSSLVSTYFTLTRATYVEVTLAVTTAVLITFFRWRGVRLSLLWPLYASLGLFIVFVAPSLVASLRGTGHLLADASLLMRYEEWAHYGGIWLNHGVAQMLFGTGLMQSSRFPITRSIVIDNVWLSLLFQLGLVGFIVVLLFLWQLWKELLNSLGARPKSMLTIGVVSACSTFPFTSIFGITTLDYFLLFMIWLASR